MPDVPPSAASEEGSVRAPGSQRPSQPGKRPLAEWDLALYMHRPEEERAFFWKNAPGSVKAAMSDAIRELPEDHRTR